MRHCVPIRLPLRSPGLEARQDIGFRHAQRLRGVRRVEQLRQPWRRRRRGARSGGGLRAEAARLVHHLLGDGKANRHLRAHAADTGAALLHALRHLELHVVVQVPDCRHARPLVDGRFDFRRHRHVLEHETGHLDAVLADQDRIDQRQQGVAKFAVARGDVEHRNLRGGERLAEHTDEPRAHDVRELVQPEMVVRAGHFLQELCGLDNPEVVGAKSAHTNDAEILVADHDRVRRAPLVAREQARDDEIDVGLEGGFEAVLPSLEARQHRDVVGRKRVLAGLEQVAVFAQVDELDVLRLAHDQLCVPLDFLVVVRPPVGQGVAGVVGPFDDFDELAADEIGQGHEHLARNTRVSRSRPRILSQGRAGRTQTRPVAS